MSTEISAEAKLAIANGAMYGHAIVLFAMAPNRMQHSNAACCCWPRSGICRRQNTPN
jgi:hypothetical protein